MLEQLDKLFASVPANWKYGIEIAIRSSCRRLPEHAQRHGRSRVQQLGGHVAHDEQLDTIGERLANLHGGSRLLLSHGRNYKTAVDKFSPYSEVKQVNERVRKATVRLMRQFMERKNRIHAYGNNRLEGCAPVTLANIIMRVRERMKQFR